MIVGLKPYSTYRDSGMPGLGSVPEHWEIRSLGSLTKARSIRGRPDLPLLSVVREKGVILRSSMTDDENHNFIPDDLSNYKVALKGDLVINKMKAWQGSLGLAPSAGIVSPAYFVYSFSIEDKRFGQALLRSKPYVAMFAQASDGVRIGQWDLSVDGMKRIPVMVPPRSEQSSIVRFLHYFDSQIRRYVNAKQKLIDFLEEARRVIIHNSVRQGIDPNATLKWSGVERLGEIPESWRIWQIGHFSRVGNGSTPSRGQAAYWLNGVYPWLNSSHANRASVDSSDQFVTETALQECHLPRVPAGSILVAITGQGKTRGKASVLEIEATINQHLAYITPRPSVALSDYLQRALTAAYLELRAISDDSGSTKGALTCEDLKHFKVAIPPIDEQRAIVTAIDNRVRNIDLMIATAVTEIDLIREYRTRLIADVVTGKLDVRGIAEGLPEEVEEPDDIQLADEILAADDEVQLTEDDLIREEVPA